MTLQELVDELQKILDGNADSEVLFRSGVTVMEINKIVPSNQTDTVFICE